MSIVNPKSVRLVHLDGLRGVAALIVVLAHLATAFRPQMFFGIENSLKPTIQTWFATSPLFVTINGPFAVYVFFVLSGFVISASADRSCGSLPATALSRFVRLSLPCAASLVFAGTLINCGLGSASEAAAIVGHWWINGMPGLFDRPAPWLDVLKYACGWYYVEGLSHFNGVLWTMQRELLGSLAIYVVFHLVHRSSRRVAVGILIAAGLVWANLEPFNYLCFVAGSILYLARIRIMQTPSLIGGTALLAGLIAGGKPFVTPPPGSFYDWPLRLAATFHGELYVWPLGAVLTVFGVLVWRPAWSVLGISATRFLGRVSFAVYLVHFPLLGCVMTRLFVKFGYISNAAFGAAALGYLLVVYLVGYIFTILVDEPATRFSTWLKRCPGQSLLAEATPVRTGLPVHQVPNSRQ